MSTDTTSEDSDSRGFLSMSLITIGVWTAILAVAYTPSVFLTGYAQYVGVVVALPLSVVWGPFTVVYIRLVFHYLTKGFTDA